MMAKYIELDAAVALLEEKIRDICPLGRCSRNAVYGADRDLYDTIQSDIEALNNLPAADVVEVRHGRWVTDGLGDGERVCSVCKRYALYTHRYSYGQYLTAYCPNCGARMDGE